MKEYFHNITIKKVVLMSLGVFLIGLAVSLCRLSGFGTDPFSCMNIGVSSVIGVSYGNYQLVVNLVLLVPMLICFRKAIGIGTIVNMVGVGYSAELCMFIWGRFGITIQFSSSIFVLRIVFLLAAVLVLCFGVALYMECDLGVAPYDALAQEMELWTKGKLKFSMGRIITDIVCVCIGFVSGRMAEIVTVGAATIVTAFFTGPFVSFFRRTFASRIVS